MRKNYVSRQYRDCADSEYVSKVGIDCKGAEFIGNKQTQKQTDKQNEHTDTQLCVLVRIDSKIFTVKNTFFK